jgi:DNA-binding transcriptional regulator YiaG
MPNIGAVLKAEITRLSRKEVKSQIEATKNAAVQHRRFIAELRREVARLQKQVAALQKTRAASAPETRATTPSRFSAKGLRSHRQRLGLSAEDYGRLVGVSAQSIYNWERQAAAPRESQKTKLAALRRVGSRAARAYLERLDSQAH